MAVSFSLIIMAVALRLEMYLFDAVSGGVYIISCVLLGDCLGLAEVSGVDLASGSKNDVTVVNLADTPDCTSRTCIKISA